MLVPCDGLNAQKCRSFQVVTALCMQGEDEGVGSVRGAGRT